METTESHLRSSFGRRQLRQITPSVVLRWQHDLEGKLSHSGVMACRSILLRILEAARRERLIPTNPVPDVEAPQATHQPRADLRARAPAHPHSRGVRPLPGCLPPLLLRPLPHPGRHRAAQRRAARVAPRRVYPELRRIEVIEVRYEPGRFGRGFKAEPKIQASVRVVPMCEQVRQAIVRQVAAGAGPDELVFPGPGGSNSIPRGLAPRCRPTTCAASNRAAVAAAGEDLAHLDLRGPHDLRHTFATWLEDAGIPARVIDEVMGHEATSRGG